MASIKPTIGRVIWFTPSPAISPGIDHRDQPLQGSIAYVHNDTSINVGGFDARGAPYAAINVKLVQEGEERPEGGHFAEWMPYQRGQAAKTDAAETAALAR